MRYVKFFIFLFALAFSSAVAQNATPTAVPDTSLRSSNGEDEINVANLVEQQIAIAQAKQWENQEKPIVQKQVLSTASATETENGWLASSILQLGLSPEMLTRIEIMFAFVMLVFGSLVTRRLVLRRRSKSNNLRSNIQSLRLEKSVVKKETKLKNIRENLIKSSIYLSNAEGSLSQKAKELKIAKGEIILAAKIKSYELSICSNER